MADSLGELMDAWCAGQAAVTALLGALGHDRFSAAQFDPADIEEAIDVRASDTASRAVAAAAGRVGRPASDPAQRRAFWKWWLLEAPGRPGSWPSRPLVINGVPAAKI